jgi:hypothetical protein
MYGFVHFLSLHYVELDGWLQASVALFPRKDSAQVFVRSLLDPVVHLTVAT